MIHRLAPFLIEKESAFIDQKSADHPTAGILNDELERNKEVKR
jgi:hypothetical protein